MTFTFASNTIGAVDVTTPTTIAPGTTNLPSTVLESQLGEIRTAWDSTLGYGEFIYLKIPATTALSAGHLVQWTAGYSVALLPVLATSKNTGHQVAVTPVAMASNTAVQYGWFQIQGQANVLETAVTVSPDSVVYASATAGRIKVLTSAGGQITGLRTANAATVTSTTSTVLCYLNRPAMQGQIT
jgi:hypothetical protein